jgi:predicted transcriptional regulator
MSPEEYRAKWGLPRDYPMVAPSYAQARSDLAKKMGLGQARRGAEGGKGAGKGGGRRGGGRSRAAATAE